MFSNKIKLRLFALQNMLFCNPVNTVDFENNVTLNKCYFVIPSTFGRRWVDVSFLLGERVIIF